MRWAARSLKWESVKWHVPMVAIPAPIIISTRPKASARHACQRQRDVILPRTTWTFHVAPDAGHARRTGPSEIFCRLCHFPTPRACIALVACTICFLAFSIRSYTSVTIACCTLISMSSRYIQLSFTRFCVCHGSNHCHTVSVGREEKIFWN